MSDLISRQQAIETIDDLYAGKMPFTVTYDAINSAFRALIRMLPSAQPEPCEDAVSRKAVEEMLKNGLPARGMWEIEGDVVKQTVCETLADALMGLERLPSAQPEHNPDDERKIADLHKMVNHLLSQQKPLKYSGVSICVHCMTSICDGCVYEPMEGDEADEAD